MRHPDVVEETILLEKRKADSSGEVTPERVKLVSTRKTRGTMLHYMQKKFLTWPSDILSVLVKRAQGQELEGGKARGDGRRSRLEKESVY